MAAEKHVTVPDALYVETALENRLGLTTSDVKQARVAKGLCASVKLV